MLCAMLCLTRLHWHPTPPPISLSPYPMRSTSGRCWKSSPPSRSAVFFGLCGPERACLRAHRSSTPSSRSGLTSHHVSYHIICAVYCMWVEVRMRMCMCSAAWCCNCRSSRRSCTCCQRRTCTSRRRTRVSSRSRCRPTPRRRCSRRNWCTRWRSVARWMPTTSCTSRRYTTTRPTTCRLLISSAIIR